MSAPIPSSIPSYTVPSLTAVPSKFEHIRLGGIDHLLTEYEPVGHPFVPFTPAVLSYPVQILTSLVGSSYKWSDQKQGVLDALSPFQVLSKLWMTQMLERALAPEYQIEEHFVFIGSWYGHQAALIRRASRLKMLSVCLIDQDRSAQTVAHQLAKDDEYFGQVTLTQIEGDVFKRQQSLARHLEGKTGSPIFVWNGLEHFDASHVKEMIHRYPDATFALQSTNLEDPTHISRCLCMDDLLAYVPPSRFNSILYAGQIESPLATRYMVIFDGHLVADD